MMETYLATITTALVITQVIRVVQNAVQLRRQGRMFREQLKDLADMKLTEQDFQIQKAFYRKGVECFDLFLTAFYDKAKDAIVNGEGKK